MTKVPTPCRVSTSEDACIFDSASRMTVRLTPNSPISAASVASLAPGGSRPSRMRSASSSTTPRARLFGRRRSRRSGFGHRRLRSAQLYDILRLHASRDFRRCSPAPDRADHRPSWPPLLPSPVPVAAGLRPAAPDRRRRRPRPGAPAAPQAPLPGAAGERHRRDGPGRRRRGGGGRAARGRRRGACAGRRRATRSSISAASRSRGRSQPILQANIVGVHNLYEAARKHGVRRVVFASSNHVTGFYRQDEVDRPGDADAARRPLRPEQGVRREPVALLLRPLRPRDGVPAHRLVVPRAEGPAHARHLAQLRRSRAPRRRQPDRAGGRAQRRLRRLRQHARRWWDNTSAAHIGFRPQDSSEPFRAAAEARQPRARPERSATTIFQGGGFVTKGPYES